MTNDELKAALKKYSFDMPDISHYETVGEYLDDEAEYRKASYMIEQAARELSQLKDGTHPDMVMVPRDVMLHARHYLDGVARDAYDSSEVCEIIYRIDKAMIADVQKGTE